MAAAVDPVQEQALWVDEQQNPARSRHQKAVDVQEGPFFQC